jgi:hypothetical protein
VPGGSQDVGPRSQRVGVDVGHHGGRASPGERLSGGQPHAGAGTDDQSHLAGEVIGRGVAVQVAEDDDAVVVGLVAVLEDEVVAGRVVPDVSHVGPRR